MVSLLSLFEIPKMLMQMHNAPQTQTALLLLLDDNTPRMLLVAVHDVPDETLELGSVVANFALLAHGDLDVDAAVVDLGNGADEELLPKKKSRQ